MSASHAAFGAQHSERMSTENVMLATLRQCKSALVALVLFSAMINFLMLTGSFYMLQVYDRVLLSYSVPTLVMLSLMTIAAFLFLGFLDVVRTRIFGRIAERIDLATGPKLYARVIRLHALRPGAPGEQMQPFRDLDAIRGFLSGTGPVALFDLPWLPFYMIICYFLHPWIGIFATLSAVLLISVAIWSEMRTKKPNLAAFEMASRRNVLAGSAIQGSEVIVTMGMVDAMSKRWRRLNQSNSQVSLQANDITSGISSASRTLRMVIQSATLGLGAYLVIKGEMTAGTIIAASIISSRAIAPVDLAVSSYRGFQQAKQGYDRLIRLFERTSEPNQRLQLVAPHRQLQVENLVVAAPNNGPIIIKGLSLQVGAGEGLGIIGQSASGKSTLARAIVGLWQPLRGSVSLDGASLWHWDQEKLGRHIGYLPHDIQLFDGTVAENISRFDEGASPDDIFKAARLAGCFEMIQQLPDGFNTRIGVGGMYLSAGQRQRLGLARALYGDPFLLVLDEPNANLDAEGEAAVTNAIMTCRNRGGAVIVIAHRPSAVQAVNKLLVLRDGVANAYGDKNEVLRKVVSNANALSTDLGAKRGNGAGAPSLGPGPRKPEPGGRDAPDGTNQKEMGEQA